MLFGPWLSVFMPYDEPLLVSDTLIISRITTEAENNHHSDHNHLLEEHLLASTMSNGSGVFIRNEYGGL